jgi:hypothetical protein
VIKKPDYEKRYASAQDRFLHGAIAKYLADSFPKLFGENIVEKMAAELIAIFEQLNRGTNTIAPGQMLWYALHKDTRADSPNKKLVPVILTLVEQEDIAMLAKGEKREIVAQRTIARLFKEAYEQGGILSTRDVALIACHSCTTVISQKRKTFEEKNNVVLPHTGVLHDMGSCITHKKQIVYKVVVEKKDPTWVAKETNHSQKAVDTYLQGYYRVKTIYQTIKDVQQIAFLTQISKHVVKQYIELYNEFEEQQK